MLTAGACCQQLEKQKVVHELEALKQRELHEKETALEHEAAQVLCMSGHSTRAREKESGRAIDR